MVLSCFVFLLVVGIPLLVFSLFKRWKEEQEQEQKQTQKPNQSNPLFEGSLSETGSETQKKCEIDSTHLTHSAHPLLLQILPSDSPKWETLFVSKGSEDPDCNGSGLDGERSQSGDQRVMKKKKKKRTKKKSSNSEDNDGGEEGVVSEISAPGSWVNHDLVCLYPFTSSSSVTQRKIKQQYDELMKCHESKGLTLAQVGQFANCLVQARKELQHKADVIQRKFTITKALLVKADRSSFDRLRQQIYKLELEQKRMDEDASVYNWLQQQLKLSPAYKKMLEIGANMEIKAKSKSEELMESSDSEFSDISFEEFLAQEKKDAFWQKNRTIKSCSC
ncbi:hypothetical protein UlMin_011942 [Ulmus minor]